MNVKRTEEEKRAKQYALNNGIGIPKIRIFENEEEFEKRRKMFYNQLRAAMRLEENIKEVELSSKQYIEEIKKFIDANDLYVVGFKKVPAITHRGSISRVLKKLEKIYDVQKIQEIHFMEFLEEEKYKERKRILEMAIKGMPEDKEIIVLETTTNIQGENEFEKAVDEMDSTGEMVGVITSGECYEKLAFNPKLANIEGILELWNADPREVIIKYK